MPSRGDRSAPAGSGTEWPLLAAGDAVGRYVIRQFLGRGGMGRVYRAEGPDGVRALKFIHPQFLGQDDFRRRFRLEAGAGKRIAHENVVRTFGCEMVQVGGKPQAILVMEYVSGRTLLQVQRELGPLPEGLILDLATGLARGLEAIHAAGVLHRDLKPENVMITEDYEVKIMDLGVARLRTEEVRLSRTGHFVGSLLFAAPEQLCDSASRCGPPADLYGAGLLLYMMATGAHPFPGGSPGEIINAHINATPAPLRARVPELTPFLEAVVETLLRKNPEERFASARALRETLEAGESSEWWIQRRPADPHGSTGALLPVRRRGPLRGRGGELRHLTEIWRRALDGGGRFVLLDGEAGIGKSRLVDALLDGLRLPPACLGLAIPPPGEGGQSFSAMRRALLGLLQGEDEVVRLREVLHTAAEHAEAFLEFLRHGDEPGSEAFSLQALQGLFVQAVRGLCEGRPRLVVAEDIDRVSDADRDVLLDLAKIAADGALVLIATARPELDATYRERLLRAPGARRLALRPLDRTHAIAFAAELVGSAALARELYGPILSRAGGNPLFLAELLEGLKDAGALRKGPTGAWRWVRGAAGTSVPATLGTLLRQRLSAAEAPVREALEVGAVQGATFDARVVARVLDRPLAAVLEALSQSGRDAPLARAEGGSWAFEPPLVRDVLLDALPADERRRLHRRTAEALERIAGERGPRAAAAVAGPVVLHYLRGGDPAAAMPLLVGAMRRLVEAFNFRDALALADEALAYRDRLDPRLVLHVLDGRARCFRKLRSSEQERRALEQLRDFAGAHGLEAPPGALDSHGQLLLARGETERARRLFERQLAAARAAGDRVAQARAQRNLAASAQHDNDPAGCRRLLESSLLLARAARHPGEEMETTRALADLFEARGQAEWAHMHHGRSLDLGARRGDGRTICAAHAGLARLALRRGRVREAQVHLDRQLSTARQTGDRVAECSALQGLGRLEMARGRLGGAGKTLGLARRLADELARRAEGAGVYADLARLALLSGDPGVLLQHATRALSRAQLVRDLDLEIRALTLAGLAAEERGDQDEAVEWLEQACERGTRSGRPGTTLEARLALARVWCAGARPELAAGVLVEVVDLARGLDLPGPRVVAEAMRAALREATPGFVRAELVRLGDRLTVHERLEVFVELATATGDELYQQEAREIVADLAHDLGQPTLPELAAGYSLYRRAMGPLSAPHNLLDLGD